MSQLPLTTEERILRMMKGVLTDIARDTHTAPGMKHPLSDNTIQGIRDCLALITAREAELADAAGRASTARPHFTDEPRTARVIPVHSIKRTKPKDNDDGD